ncbi:hypothetical protein J3458_004275 [Metarhizium acridum]|uniref:uncharacterized protein n=1 Tax=Metarhizium acridum TaxID=92637 RepID=UPI001C6BA548|nr:hypothetical protein J3458_004275 [Metarhizium acridum]
MPRKLPIITTGVCQPTLGVVDRYVCDLLGHGSHLGGNVADDAVPDLFTRHKHSQLLYTIAILQYSNGASRRQLLAPSFYFRQIPIIQEPPSRYHRRNAQRPPSEQKGGGNK